MRRLRCFSPGSAAIGPDTLAGSRRELFFRQAPEHFLQIVYSRTQFVERLSFGIGQFTVFQLVATLRTHADDASRNSDHGAVVRHGFDHDGPGSDFDVVAQTDIAKDLRPGADDDVIADGGMAFALFFAGTAEGDVLVDEDIVTDLSGLPDHHSHAVIDKEAPPYLGTGVYLDSGEEAANL